MKDRIFKQIYAFTVLGLTILWAAALLAVVVKAFLIAPGISDVVAAAGVGGLLGAFIVWNTNINQHYYRKKQVETEEEGSAEG